MQVALAWETGVSYLRGSSEREGIFGEPLTGPSGGLRLEGAVYGRFHPAVELGMGLTGGWRFFSVIGRVLGEESVSWLGPWGSLDLRMRFSFQGEG